jgi:hypothetical protein
MLTREIVSDLMAEMANFGIMYCEAERAEYPPELLDKIFKIRLGKVAAEMRKLQAMMKGEE